MLLAKQMLLLVILCMSLCVSEKLLIQNVYNLVGICFMVPVLKVIHFGDI